MWGAIIGGLVGAIGNWLGGKSQSDAIGSQQGMTSDLLKQARNERLNAYTEGANNARDVFELGRKGLDRLYNAKTGVLANQLNVARSQADLAAARSGLVGGSQAQNLLNPSITAATVQAAQEEKAAQLQLLANYGQSINSLSQGKMGGAANVESGAQAGVINAGQAYANPWVQGLGGLLSGIGTGLTFDRTFNKTGIGSPKATQEEQ